MREDEALWAQVTRRTATAFEQVYRDNFARVRSFLRIYLGNTSVVDDEKLQDSSGEQPHAIWVRLSNGSSLPEARSAGPAVQRRKTRAIASVFCAVPGMHRPHSG